MPPKKSAKDAREKLARVLESTTLDVPCSSSATEHSAAADGRLTYREFINQIYKDEARRAGRSYLSIQTDVKNDGSWERYKEDLKLPFVGSQLSQTPVQEADEVENEDNQEDDDDQEDEGDEGDANTNLDWGAGINDELGYPEEEYEGDEGDEEKETI